MLTKLVSLTTTADSGATGAAATRGSGMTGTRETRGSGVTPVREMPSVITHLTSL